MPERIVRALAGHRPADPRPPSPRSSSAASSTASPRPSPAPVLEAEQLSGHDVDVVHLVGGGSQNALLCQLTADAAGKPVVAGPVEATALGNLLVQARTHGVVVRRPRRAACRAPRQLRAASRPHAMT